MACAFRVPSCGDSSTQLDPTLTSTYFQAHVRLKHSNLTCSIGGSLVQHTLAAESALYLASLHQLPGYCTQVPLHCHRLHGCCSLGSHGVALPPRNVSKLQQLPGNLSHAVGVLIMCIGLCCLSVADLADACSAESYQGS